MSNRCHITRASSNKLLIDMGDNKWQSRAIFWLSWSWREFERSARCDARTAVAKWPTLASPAVAKARPIEALEASIAGPPCTW